MSTTMLEKANDGVREKFQNSFETAPPSKTELKTERDFLLKQNDITREQLYKLADSNLLNTEGYFLYSKIKKLGFRFG